MGKVSAFLCLKESGSRQYGGKRLVDSILKSKPLRWKSIPKIGSRFTTKGDKFEGYYDEKPIAEIKDKGFRKGKVGARVYGSTAHIDDFDVNGKGLEPSPVEAKDKL